MVADYQSFLLEKEVIVPPSGFDIDREALNANLFQFQRDLVQWALRKGRAALFCDTGLGKTIQQLVWAEEVARHTSKPVLIFAPLAVARQTVREAVKFGIAYPVQYVRSQSVVVLDQPGIYITNYEMLEHFRPADFAGVVLDESSILKSQASKTRAALIAACKQTPYRLCCTATPAPNDLEELCNHAEFLGIISKQEMHAKFFINAVETIKKPGGQKIRTNKQAWRLKGHASGTPDKPGPFWEWLASWSMSITKPSDLGYPDDGYTLPALTVEPVIVESDYRPVDRLFFTEISGIQEAARIRHDTLEIRAQKTAELVATAPDKQWLIWVDYNEEDERLAKLIPDAVVVRGSESPEAKADKLSQFAQGSIRVLITKTEIAGFGMNFQGCCRMIFCGINYSWESFYQAIRRIFRFGQLNECLVYLVMADVMQDIYQVLMRKEKEARQLSQNLVKFVGKLSQAELGQVRTQSHYSPSKDMFIPDWLLPAA